MSGVVVVSADRLAGEAATAALAAAGWGAVSFAADGLAAVAAVARDAPEVVLVIGPDLPRLGPIALAQQVRRRFPDVMVVVIGSVATPDATTLPASCTTDDVLRALRASPGEREAPAPQGAGDLSALGRLTRRQRVVLRLLVEGRDMRQIAVDLGVSEHTVRTHMQNLYARLGCHSRLELVRWATAQGVLSGESGSPSG